MTGIIEIEDMEFFAYHGCFEAEQIVGNKFLLNAEIHYDCEKAALSDNVKEALNYQEVYENLKKEIMIRSDILENVVHRMLNMIFDKFPQAQYAKIKISKMHPPLGGKLKATSLTIERRR